MDKYIQTIKRLIKPAILNPMRAEYIYIEAFSTMFIQFTGRKMRLEVITNNHHLLYIAMHSSVFATIPAVNPMVL